MSTEKIWGPWDQPSEYLDDSWSKDEAHRLWYLLAAQRVGTPDQRNNCGLSQRRAEITTLWDIYLRAKPKVVLEVGVSQAGTWAGWCHLGEPDALIIGIDRCVNDARPRRGEPVSDKIARPHLMDRMTTQGGGMYAYAKGTQRIVPINGWTTDSATREELSSVLAGRTIDFCFHDASHSAEMFKGDFEWLWPLISDGGIFASHDIMRSDDPNCNKRDHWLWIKENVDYSACFEFCGGRNDQNMGIGALVK